MAGTTICVLGLGYVGLPTAAMFAIAGHTVIGVDPSPRVQEALTSGRLHLQEPGRDVCLAHCPERVLPGRILLELAENDRLAGGLTPTCAERAAQVYASFVKGTIVRTDATTAEMAKVMENTYRDVNVALANEFARIADRLGVDVP